MKLVQLYPGQWVDPGAVVRVSIVNRFPSKDGEPVPHGLAVTLANGEGFNWPVTDRAVARTEADRLAQLINDAF